MGQEPLSGPGYQCREAFTPYEQWLNDSLGANLIAITTESLVQLNAYSGWHGVS